MYGTVARMKVKPGMEQKLNALMEQWWSERGNKIKGATSTTVFRTDNNPNELVMIAVFDTKENYTANAEDPEQDRWYRQMLECLEGEPSWTDGEVIYEKHVH